MDCVIKSSNRPYMLDWCIRSLKERAEGSIGQIFIADDGTPSQYLDEIVSRHPDVIILHSGRYFPDAQDLTWDKSESEEPVFECWREAVRRCSGDYFLLLEDDIALIRSMNFEVIENQLGLNRVQHYKLVEWNINFDQLDKHTHNESGEISYFGRPSFLTKASRNLVWRSILLSEFSSCTIGFQIWRAARALHLHPRNQWLLNYQIYSLAGVIISRDWWLWLWHRPMTEFNERPSMELALKSMLSNRSLQTGYIARPALTKSYRSKARNNLPAQESGFSVDIMNLTLNEAWLHGDFSLDVDDLDLADDQVLEVFSNAGLTREFGQQWIEWYGRTTDNLKNLGFY